MNSVVTVNVDLGIGRSVNVRTMNCDMCVTGYKFDRIVKPDLSNLGVSLPAPAPTALPSIIVSSSSQQVLQPAGALTSMS